MIPDDYRDLLDETNDKAFIVLAFTLANGAPLAAPIWFLANDDALLLSIAPDSLKARCLRARPVVSALIMAEGQHDRYVSVRGKAVELHDADAPALYRRIIRKYYGKEPSKEEWTAFFRLVPERVAAYDYTDVDA